MNEDAIIVLDPVNKPVIDSGLSSGIRTFVGGNCTVSLMLMALSGLLASEHVEWISSMTYQAASGAGAKNMIELMAQMHALGDASKDLLNHPAASAIEMDAVVTKELRKASFPTDHFGVPLAGSLIPWIDASMESGQTGRNGRGSWKRTRSSSPKSPSLLMAFACG
jgi:aspartate-semialdehyde dehydrogenase